jgi:HTH-type transcriptional regulator/antitoxin HipB
MNFPLRIADQLKPHLRALRKRHGLTQAQLGALVGVKQARIAEVEANPGAVSLDQLIKLLAALGGTLHLHTADDAPATVAPSPPQAPPKPVRATKRPAPTPAGKAVKIPAKKGVW